MLGKLPLISLREIHVISFINLLLKICLFLCELMFCLHKCVCESATSSETGVTDNCEGHVGAGPLEEQSVLPAAELGSSLYRFCFQGLSLMGCYDITADSSRSGFYSVL